MPELSEPQRPTFNALPPANPDSDAQRQADSIERQRVQRDGIWNKLVGEIGGRYGDCRIAAMEVYDERQKPVLAAVEEYGRNLAERCSSGKSLVLYGTPGTGKDHILAALMRLAIISHGKTVEWRNGMDLHGDFRDSLDLKETRESALIKKLVSPDILVISDPVPPFGDLTQFQAATLFRIIDGRYRQRKPTWLSMNVASGSELAGKVSEAIVDRLRHGALTLHCNWLSYRAK